VPCVEGAERYDYDECEAGIGSSFTKGKVVNFFHHRGHGGTQRKISRPLGTQRKISRPLGVLVVNPFLKWNRKIIFYDQGHRGVQRICDMQ